MILWFYDSNTIVQNDSYYNKPLAFTLQQNFDFREKNMSFVKMDQSGTKWKMTLQ